MATSKGNPAGRSKSDGAVGGNETTSTQARRGPLVAEVWKGVWPLSKLSGVAVEGMRPSWMRRHEGVDAWTETVLFAKRTAWTVLRSASAEMRKVMNMMAVVWRKRQDGKKDYEGWER